MPSRMSNANLVARPDRVDFRDRAYLPPLRSLPSQWPPRDLIATHLKDYSAYILDQGKEGACTGFGLAAVINFIFWSRWRERLHTLNTAEAAQEIRPKLVSPHMLYHNAKIYDEWEGSDYEGSSCRGAMKGWHKHGVCDETQWKVNAEKQTDQWMADAAKRPLGAYYRIEAKSIADIQAAIFEVRSVYCSGEVHAGWDSPQGIAEADGMKMKLIIPKKGSTGGHAFALVGYTTDGFIVQNSWGRDWGTGGFALLTYEDWVKNGFDAWVAALGAPMNVTAPSTAGRMNLMSVPAQYQRAGRGRVASSANDPTKPWSEEQAYRHAIVMGNDGKLIQRIVGARDPETALTIVTQDEVKKAGHGHIAIYVHGGLNKEQDAIARARRLGPWFTANGIHPLFVVWRTGVLESLGQIALDEVKKYEDQVKSIRSRGIGDAIDAALNAARNAFDRAFETAAEKLIGKAVWSQMKQNAAMAAARSGPLAALAKSLSVHSRKPIHLLGHSAGSIMIGHMLDVASRGPTRLNFASCGLYAPACTMGFAAEKFGQALNGGPLAKGTLHIDNLSDVAETKDSVGPYGKSLLYLVSRALEDTHKMPLLGLELAHQKEGKGKEMELASTEHARDYAKWQAAVGRLARVTTRFHKGPSIRVSGRETTDISHGSFDNDINVINASIARILGKKPDVSVTDLTGF